MAFGLLGNVVTVNKDQDYTLYQASAGEKAVGTIVLSRLDFDYDHVPLVLITSSSLPSSSFITNPSLYGILFSGLIKAATTPSESLPLVISGVVVGPNQRIVVIDNDLGGGATPELYVTFNGVEESV